MRPAIKMWSGRYFDFVNPDSTPISPTEIARGLANTCRFAGQLIDHYSVAQHSVLVSYLVPLELAFEGLMHDASEAVMHDISAPLKQLLNDYQLIEHRVEDSIMRQYNVNWRRREIKRADLVALATEKRDLCVDQDNGDDYWAVIHGVQPDPRRIHPWPIQDAFARWLDRFNELRPGWE